MTNKQLINARWKFTDRLLKQCHKNFKSIFSEIQDELIDLFNSFNLKRENLNKTLSSTDKRKYDRDKRDWKDRNIVTPYFQFLLDTTTKLTYSNVLKIYVFALYLKYSKKEFDECKNLFVAIANNTYEQAKKDLNIKSNDHLTWSLIRDWAIVQTINVPFEDYILILCQTSSEETSRLFINAINQGLSLKHSDLSKIIQKQTNRFISINEERSSGVIENTSRQVGNMAYTEPFPNQLIKFVAEMDDKTTRMCMSMNDYIFNTKDRNVFYRYSDEAKKLVKYDIYGLVLGINQPPIMDHFHYCRSILTYQVDMTDKEIRKMLHNESVA